MLAWFIARNKFWFIESFVYTLLLLPLTYLYYTAYNRVKHQKDTGLTANERWFLTTSFVHVCTQLFYHFIYPFSILYYIVTTIFFIEIICLNDTFTVHLNHLSEKLRGYIEQGCKYAILFFLIYGVYAILQIHSANQCGQNLMYITLPIYLALTAFTVAEIGYIIKKKNDDINDIINIRLSVLGKENEAEIDYRRQNVNKLKMQKVFFTHLLITIVVAYLINSVLYYQKFRLIHTKEATCATLFENKHTIFMVLFSILEAFGTNVLNCFVFYYYYWIRRQEFSFVDSKVSFSEGYEGLRSIMLLETER